MQQLEGRVVVVTGAGCGIGREHALLFYAGIISEYLEAIAAGLRDRAEDIAQIWPRQAGVLYAIAQHGASGAADVFDYDAGLAAGYPFVEEHTPTAGGALGLLVREPVGVVGAIVPWNAPIGSMSVKVAPALLAGCTLVVKPSRIAFGGFKQSGVGREGGREGLLPYVELKTVILEDTPSALTAEGAS